MNPLPVAFLSALLFALACRAEDIPWVEISREQVDTRLLSPRGQRLLEDDEFKWDHAKSGPFIIHFERKQFAQKVARMADFFYSFISEDLKTAEDRAPGPSHIFIFRRERDWEYFIEQYRVSTEWAISMVSGFTMFLQEADDRNTSGQILSHEMTHMVFNRFYGVRIPLWLNEGIAEWYGTFGYDAYRGVRRNKRHIFKRVDELYPLAGLLGAQAYPADADAVRAFYETSKYLVGFLQLNYPEETFELFLRDVVRGLDAQRALERHYEIASIEEFVREFQRFSR